MRTIFSLLLLLITFSGIATGQTTKNRSTAEEWLEKSIRAMGGNSWRQLKSISYSGIGYVQAIEQSERPEGPYLPMPLNKSVLKDYQKNQALVTESAAFYNTGNRMSYVIDNGYSAIRMRGGRLFPWEQDHIVEDDQNITPEVILYTALKANNLTYTKDTLIQQVANVILGFHLDNKYPTRLFINKETDFLTGVEIIKPYSSGFLNIWGDTKKLTLYSFWNILDKENKLHYPLQADTYVNGWYLSSFVINKWTLNAPVGGDSLHISDSLKLVLSKQGKEKYAPYEKGLKEGAKEIAPGVWYLPGPCNSTVIEQLDGLVVLDAGSSSHYGSLLLEKINQIFPGKKIKAIASTSDAWLHIGGVRTFAALPNITIYHPKRNTWILNRLLNAQYTTEPDVLAKTKIKSYKMQAIEDTLAIGSGSNKIILYTFKTESGERMMMAYFPNHQLLYASDLFQPKGRDGQYWQPHYSWEVYQAIKKRNISVKNFYGMHTELLPISYLESDFK